MAPNAWLEIILPCMRSRSKEKGDQPRPAKDILSSGSFADVNRQPSLGKPAAHVYDDGLEAVLKTRPQTLLVPELPCPTPKAHTFDISQLQRPFVDRSKSDGLPPSHSNNNKTLRGKRKRSQTFNIGGPTDVRRGTSDDPKLAFPLTYPSPSRLRPEKLTMDRRDPSIENERPRTAPSGPQRKDSFPLRPNSITQVQGGSHKWRLAPLPPMPALEVDNKVRNRSGSGGSIKRKPVPLRIGGSGAPAVPGINQPVEGVSQGTGTDLGPIGFAIEMPGSLPHTAMAAQRSPFELLGTLPTQAPVEKGPDTPLAELDAALRKASVISFMSSAPNSPTSPVYAHRLSEGALDLLNFFPTTPKLSRANSMKTIHRASSTPPLSPRLVQYAEAKFPSYSPRLGGGVAAVISPSAISPNTVLPLAQVKQSPALGQRSAQRAFTFADKSLPPTPASAGFVRDRFMSIAVGMEMGDMPGVIGLGISPDSGKHERAASGESIQIYMATTAERVQLRA